MRIQGVSNSDPYICILRAILLNVLETSEKPSLIGCSPVSARYNLLKDNVRFALEDNIIMSSASELFSIDEELFRKTIIKRCKKTLERPEFVAYEKLLLERNGKRVYKKKKVNPNAWSYVDDMRLKKLYKTKKYKEIAEIMGKSKHSIVYRLEQLGLRKNKKGIDNGK